MNTHTHTQYWQPQNAEAVIGSRYIKMLTSYKPKLVWHAAHHEHSFTYKKGEEEHTVFYPTLKVPLLFVFFVFSLFRVRVCIVVQF